MPKAISARRAVPKRFVTSGKSAPVTPEEQGGAAGGDHPAVDLGRLEAGIDLAYGRRGRRRGGADPGTRAGRGRPARPAPRLSIEADGRLAISVVDRQVHPLPFSTTETSSRGATVGTPTWKTAGTFWVCFSWRRLGDHAQVDEDLAHVDVTRFEGGTDAALAVEHARITGPTGIDFPFHLSGSCSSISRASTQLRRAAGESRPFRAR